MQTDHLIRTLVADNDWRARPLALLLMTALAVAGSISLAMFFATLGMRKDFVASLSNPFFDLKFAVALTLAFAALLAALRLSRPGASLRGRAWLLGLPAVLLVAGIAGDFIVPQSKGWTARLVGSNSRVCLIAIPALALPLLLGTLTAMRQGAATRPAIAGAFAGLLAGGLAAAIYAAHCPDDSPLFVATWYTLGIVLVASIGAAAGARVLRI